MSVSYLYFLKLFTLVHNNKRGRFRPISVSFHTYYCILNGSVLYNIPYLAHITEHCMFFSFDVHLCCYVVALSLRLPGIQLNASVPTSTLTTNTVTAENSYFPIYNWSVFLLKNWFCYLEFTQSIIHFTTADESVYRTKRVPYYCIELFLLYPCYC